MNIMICILKLTHYFSNFRKIYWKVYHLDPVKLVLVLGLAWQAALNIAEVKLESSTDIDVLLMVEKGTSGGIHYAIHLYAKGNRKYMKDYDEKKESLNIGM